jgi:uncharacterized protein YndB with AHSA1/START domain
MVKEERTIQIGAPPDKVWAVMVDIERWPEWTVSIRSAKLMTAAGLGFGSEARLGVKGSPSKSVWRVTEFTPARSFTWESSSLGVRSVATHVVEPDGDGTKVTLRVEIDGLLVTILSPMFRSVSKNNLEMEAEGLKHRAEAPA